MAAQVLKGTELPKMQQGKQGRLDPSLNMQPEVFLPLLVNLTQASQHAPPPLGCSFTPC